MLRSRRNVLESDRGTGWLRTCVGEPWVIHHDANSLCTATSRMRHKGVVNIPRVTSAYGEEFRSLFTAPPGMVMVGWDAQALEAVIEAHYVYRFDPEYSEILVSGSSDAGTDVHTRNSELLGISRDQAKTFKYAITYGAGPSRLASTLGIKIEPATELYNDFWANNKGLRTLRDLLRTKWEACDKKGFWGIDGRWVSCKSEYQLLNYLFQSGGAILMKYAAVIAEHTIHKLTTEAYSLIKYHDEEQWASPHALCHSVGKLGVQSIEKAGRYLNLKVPITGDYKVGATWADTH